MFAFLVLGRDRAPEKRKVGSSTLPLTTRSEDICSLSHLCENRSKRENLVAGTAGLTYQNPRITHNYAMSEHHQADQFRPALAEFRADRVG
jgi:hypothetical protein